MDIRAWFAKLRYPTPEMGDFVGDMKLDEYTEEDHDDNQAAKKEPVKKGKR
jgi:hypothetical protein